MLSLQEIKKSIVITQPTTVAVLLLVAAWHQSSITILVGAMTQAIKIVTALGKLARTKTPMHGIMGGIPTTTGIIITVGATPIMAGEDALLPSQLVVVEAIAEAAVVVEAVGRAEVAIDLIAASPSLFFQHKNL